MVFAEQVKVTPFTSKMDEELQKKRRWLDQKEREVKEYNEKYPPQTLFPPNWKALPDYCPFCGLTLYRMRDRAIRYCKSKKHKGFIISDKKLKEICQKDTSVG